MMGEYASGRPSKRRRVLGEAKDESQSPNPQNLTVTRRSSRNKHEAKSDKDSVLHPNGAEEKTDTRSSVQRRSDTRRATGDKDVNVEERVTGTSSAAVRSSGRLRNRGGKSEDTGAAQRSTPRRSSKNAATVPPKTSAEVSGLNSNGSKPIKSKARRNGLQEKSMRDGSTNNGDSDEALSDSSRHNAVNGSAASTNQERGKDADGGDGRDGGALDSAAQLQQELDNTGDPAVQSNELPRYAENLQRLCEKDGIARNLDALGRFVLEKLCGKRRVPLRGLDSEYDTVHQLVEQTVVAGEGNSMLLLGARGCGKTSVVETAISALARDHHEDFHVVRLNGFLHTDDKVALRDIWRQLGREVGTEDELNKVSSYADTMATLLALLSHPEELFGPSEEVNSIKTTKSVIIILDEFDLFASHPRQTLLYNLFDIAQAKKAPVAVLGLTTKVDVTENLEKRVKSRFSHRYVFLPRPRSFAQFSDICLAALTIEENESSQSHVFGNRGEDIAAALETQQGKELIRGWNTYLKGLWEDPAFQTVLQQTFHRTRCPRDFFTCSLVPLCSVLFRSDPKTIDVPTPASFASQTLSCPDPPPLPFYIPPQVSTSTTSLPLSLLLTATRLTALHEPSLNNTQGPTSGALALSFAAVYAEYVRLLTTAKVSASASGAAATPGRIWGKVVAQESWEKLVDWGLIMPVARGSGIGGTRTFRVEVSFEEVVDSMGEAGSGALGRWWKDT